MKKQTLPIVFVLLALLLTATACNLPVATPAATAPANGETAVSQSAPATLEVTDAPTEAPVEATTQAPTVNAGNLVSANGVSFYYDPSLAGGVSATIQPAAPYSDSLPYWEITSEQAVFTFENYLIGDHLHTAAIRVFSLDEYVLAFDSEILIDEAASLATLIADRDEAYQGQVAIFPQWPAAEMMSSNFSYLDFNGGSGVRFLAQHGQAALPINNHEIAYIFEGFTSDHRWYVQAVFPINHPLLQADSSQIPGGDYEAFVEMSNYQAYITGIRDLLESQPDDSFTPNLELLDALVRSITITR